MVETSNSAITSLILGIVSIPFIWVFGIGIILGILSIIFGIISLRNIKKEKLAGKNMAIAGIITGCISIILVLFIVILAYFGILTPEQSNP